MPETFLRIGTRTVAVCVFLLLIAGALVTSTQSGLAVPDWPLSYGKVMPPMVGGILYEHGHRLVAAAVSTLVGLEMATLFFFEGRKTVRLLGVIAFVAILAQALLGGLTVLFLLPPAVSSAHAALAEIVFALTAVVALMCSKGWENFRISLKGEEARSAFRWVVLATAAVYLQIVVGAVMRHTGAGLAIPDFPTSFGGLLPTFEEISRPGVPVHLAHRLGALAVVLLVFRAAKALAALSERLPLLATAGAAWAGLVCLQAFLGASSIWSAKAVPLTVAHLAVGALCWVIGVLASVALAAGFSDKLARD
ncbi:MAG TPA: COX15/CtaA family protein [Thermoanaerobaculia bacterium]|nr:COX15/CtaA family protein [Thermoanaerobaculia bacterium]